MLPIAVLMVWGGYTGIIYGYCLIRGYNVSLKEIVSPTGWYSGVWPPPAAGNTQIFPDGGAGGAQIVTTAAISTDNAGGTSSGGGNPPGTNLAGRDVGGTAKANKAIAKKIIKDNPSFSGWASGSQWASLVNLWNQESGWNAEATNPSSGAYGIAQSLHGTKGGKGGDMYNTSAAYGLSAQQLKLANNGNASAQIAWGLRYIQAVYGSPAQAWAHEQSQGWY
jgi:hypothetical protein